MPRPKPTRTWSIWTVVGELAMAFLTYLLAGIAERIGGAIGKWLLKKLKCLRKRKAPKT